MPIIKKKIADDARALEKRFPLATKDIAKIASKFVRSDEQDEGVVRVLLEQTKLFRHKYGYPTESMDDPGFFSTPY